MPTEQKMLPSIEATLAAGQVLTEACHGRAWNAGWWHDINTGEKLDRNVPEMLCLIHSEVSEALEGFRKNMMDDKLPHRKMIEVELADVIIRVFDLAGGLNLDVAGAIVEKMLYNANREDHKVENRKGENGKKI